MKRILFYFLYGLVWLITRLPLRFLYVFSDLLFPVLFYIVPYRKKLVLKNMRNAFPEWDEKKVQRTARKFYHYFCDSFIEGLVTLFLPEEELRKAICVPESRRVQCPFRAGTEHCPGDGPLRKLGMVFDHARIYPAQDFSHIQAPSQPVLRQVH